MSARVDFAVAVVFALWAGVEKGAPMERGRRGTSVEKAPNGPHYWGYSTRMQLMSSFAIGRNYCMTFVVTG